MKGETEQRITNKRNKRKFIVPVIFCVCFVMMVSMVIPMALAYFTATSNQTGELSFAALTTSIIDNSGNTMTNGTFSSTFLSEKLLPGKEINFTNIKVKNTSNTNIYTLLKLTVTITKTGVATLIYTNWYTLNGEIVSTSNFSTNNHYATYLSSNSTANVNLTYTIPTEINNDYKSATAEFTLSAHSIQDYVPQAENYIDKINYKTYLIIKKTDSIATEFESRELPEIYNSVNYLESTGTQYIDTGFVGDVGTKFEIDLKLNNITQDEQLMGRNWYNNGAIAIGYAYNASTTQFLGQAGHTLIFNGVLDLNRHLMSLSIDSDSEATFSYDGISVQGDISFTKTLETLTLFARRNSANNDLARWVYGKLYASRIFNTNTLIRDFVPCVRVSDTKPGLYDKVNDVFYTNAGSGEFLYG